MTEVQEVEYNPATVAYVSLLLQPYANSLEEANSVESLIAWTPLVIPEYSEQINAAISELELPVAKSVLLQTLSSLLLSPDTPTITPWEISMNRSELAARLFGPSSLTIPITVSVGPNKFEHYLNQDQTYGILVGLEAHPEFVISIGIQPLNRTVLDYRYSSPSNQNGPFIATLNNNENDKISFGSPEFVQGVITAAEWTSKDPHTIITSLIQINEDNSETLLNF